MNQKINAGNKIVLIIFALIISVSGVFAQTSIGKEVLLATTNGKSFTVNDLDPNAAQAWNQLGETIAKGRQAALEAEIARLLFEIEAKSRLTTVDKLIDLEVKRRLIVPKDAEIQQVYEANRAQIGDKTPAEMRAPIIAFLQKRQEDDLQLQLAKKLQNKYKATINADVNAPNLKPADILVSVAGKQITDADFEEKVKPAIYELRIQVYEAMKISLEETVYSNLVLTEARNQKIEPEILIRREISDKITVQTPEEQARLQTLWQDKLFRQYNVKFNLQEPEAPTLKISVANAPSRGKIDAPVTVVMFSDFQCSHCARTHPILQEVLQKYGDKIRFVVRNFPLTEVHENAFISAQAAAAANAQGKFFEYIEILYQNQEALDTASLKKYAAQIGLDEKKFALDLDSGKFANTVEKDRAEGEGYGINATPTIFINGVKVRDYSAAGFQKQIEKALAQKARQK